MIRYWVFDQTMLDEALREFCGEDPDITRAGVRRVLDRAEIASLITEFLGSEAARRAKMLIDRATVGAEPKP